MTYHLVMRVRIRNPHARGIQDFSDRLFEITTSEPVTRAKLINLWFSYFGEMWEAFSVTGVMEELLPEN